MLGNPIFLWFFGRGGGPDPMPSLLDPRMIWRNILSIKSILLGKWPHILATSLNSTWVYQPKNTTFRCIEHVAETRPLGYKTWVHSQTQNKTQWLAACGHVSASSQPLCFILSLRIRVRKQPIIVFYFEFENELKFYNLRAWCPDNILHVRSNTVYNQP